MDDGSPAPDVSIEMLRMEAQQGVDAVVLTPHFYRDRERPEHFLERRQRSAAQLLDVLQKLPDEERGKLPALFLGAEVAWVPNLSDLVDLTQFRLGKSGYFLLELPFSPWHESMVHQIYDLMGRTGLTPVIAHLERYWRSQSTQMLCDVLELGVPVQVTAHELSRPFSPAMKLLRGRQAQLVASDCHNVKRRPPDLGPAMRTVERKLGAKRRGEIARQADGLLKERG
jgi:protein-tyrosine phosphatase